MLVKKRALRYNKQQKPDSLKWRHIMVEEAKRTLAYLCPACRLSLARMRSKSLSKSLQALASMR